MANLYRQLCQTMANADNDLRTIIAYAKGGEVNKNKKPSNKSEDSLNYNDSDNYEYDIETPSKSTDNYNIPAPLYNGIKEPPLAVLKPYKKPLIYYITDGHLGHRIVGAYGMLGDLGAKIDNNIIQPVKDKLDDIFVQPIRNTLNRLDERGEEYINNYKSNRKTQK